MWSARQLLCAAATVVLAFASACDSSPQRLTAPTSLRQSVAGSNNVPIYLPYCPESICETPGDAYISHFTGANCTGAESYYTPYFYYDGVPRTWDGRGRLGTVRRTIANRSYKDASGQCYTPSAWQPSGNVLSDFVSVYRASCEEASCARVEGAYISHYTAPNCTGPEAYYTPYFYYDGVRRSWDGGGIVGNELRTLTTYSYRDETGQCYTPPAWQDGSNTLNGFVNVYRGGPEDIFS